jgi:hypothetical protein
MKRLALLLFALTSAQFAVASCTYDAARPHIEVTYIATAIAVGDEHNTVIRIDAAGCLETVYPVFHKRAGTHRLRIDPAAAARLRAAIDDGNLVGMTEAKLHAATRAKGLSETVETPDVTDAPITEIRITEPGKKRSRDAIRIEALGFRDIRPVAKEWFALREVAREAVALAERAAWGTLGADRQ